jgi:LuxR family maltose regulon positive regulatory protein
LTEKITRRTPPLLQSKLAPPLAGRFVVPRTRLVDAVSSAPHARLVLVRAPAGFGKTTLMAECHADQRRRGNAAWLTLDAADNDPVRLLTYLVAALERSMPPLELRAEEASGLFAGHAPAGAFLYLLDRIAALSGPLTIFLDDFSVLRSPEALEIVRQLLHHLPAGKRLMIALRHGAELGLGRLRAQGELLELELADLRFTREEAEQFVRRTRGLELDDGEVDRLHRFTEGWVAGLQLSTLAPRARDEAARSGAGVASAISEYLVEEVLTAQPEPVQTFLLETSALKTLCAPLCDAVTGRTDGAELLSLLERQNLFVVPLDEERRWFRYHSIFASFLRSRLEQRDAARLKRVHAAACEWYASTGKPELAAEHALAAGDVVLASEYMGRCAFDLVRVGQAATVAEWADALPQELLDRHLELQLAYAYALTHRYQYDRALAVLERLAANAGRAGAAPAFLRDVRCVRAVALFVNDQMAECEQVTREVLAEPGIAEDRQTRFLPSLFSCAAYVDMTAGRLVQAQRNIARSGQLAGQAPWVWKLYGRFVAGSLSLSRGRLAEALDLTSSALEEIGASPARYSGAGTALAVVEAEILYERNRLDEAERLLGSCRAMLPTVLPDIVIVGFRTLARLQLARGDDAEARRLLSRLERLGVERGAPRIAATARQERARIALARGEVARACEALGEHDDDATWASFGGRCLKGSDPEMPAVTRLRLMLAQGQARRALEPLGDALARAVAAGFVRQELLLRVLVARAHDLCGARREALRALKEALVAAQGEGFVRTFVDEGDRVAAMLRELRAQASPDAAPGGHRDGLSLAYLDEVLRATGAGPAPDEAEAPPAPAEPLTERELEILRKVALGLTNETLGAQLFVSVHTVRFHLRNINMKLGAQTRTQAVAIARRMRLIP